MNLEALRHQWMPVCIEKKITKRPKRYLLLGEPLVMYRVNNTIVAFQDRCPHRGVPLSAGKLVGDTLQCHYHGWRFNTKGHCVEIPGLVKKAPLTNKCLKSYPIRIHYGLVFICMEPKDTTLPLYEIPALANPAYESHVMEFKIQGDILNVIENTLDATHTHYVHAGLLRRERKRQTIKAELTVTPISAQVLYKEEQKPSGIISSLFEKNREASLGRFHAPLLIELEYFAKDHITAAFTFFICPMTESNHHVFLLISYRKHRFTSWLKKILFYPFIQIAFKQDLRVLRLQDMNKLWFPDSGFKSTELDILRPHIERILLNRSTNYKKVITMRV